MPPDNEFVTAVGLGISLSACCGFRVFIPLLGTSIAAFAGWLALPMDMQWLASWPAIICFGTAALLEVAAYYIAFLDNVLDSICTPLAVIAGTLLAFSILPIEGEPLLRWVLALMAGGAPAGTIQIGASLIRLFSTKATVGSGNAFVASGENIAAVSGVALSFIIPVILAILLLLLSMWVIFRTVRRLVRKEGQIY